MLTWENLMMPFLHFTKMNGAGNDFVMLDNRDGKLSLTQTQIARLCDRHRGIGADGLIMVEPAQGKADWRMRYHNADGAEVEMCGNGARCFARFVSKIAPVKNGAVTFETPAGIISAKLAGKLRFLDSTCVGKGEGEEIVLQSISCRLTVCAASVASTDCHPPGRIINAPFARSEEEQQRGITMKSSAISLLHTKELRRRGQKGKRIICEFFLFFFFFFGFRTPPCQVEPQPRRPNGGGGKGSFVSCASALSFLLTD